MSASSFLWATFKNSEGKRSRRFFEPTVVSHFIQADISDESLMLEFGEPKMRRNLSQHLARADSAPLRAR